MDNYLDTASRFVAGIMRYIWGCVSLAAFCAGTGGILTALALWDLNYWPTWLVVGWSLGCLFLIWVSAPIQKRYQRWLRTADNPQGELK